VSPWEIAAFIVVLPFVALGVWLNEHFGTDGPRVPEFEAWCRRVRPTLFALRASPQRAAAIAADLRSVIGARAVVEHGRGRFPWTRYVFTVSVKHIAGDSVVRVIVERPAIRRSRSSQPDLVAIAHRIVADAASGLDAVWMHTELREGDPARGEARRGRGWVATVERGALSEFLAVPALPEWASETPSSEKTN